MAKFEEKLINYIRELEIEQLCEDLIPPTGMSQNISGGSAGGGTMGSTTTPSASANDPNAAVEDFVNNHPGVIQAKQVALADHQKQLAAQAVAAQQQLQKIHASLS